MIMLSEINEYMRVKYKRVKGQVYLDIPVVFEGSTNSDRVEFMYVEKV